MKEQLLDHIHQALAIQLNELTAYYEQQLTKLKRENGALLTKVHKLEKQVAKLQKNEKIRPAPNTATKPQAPTQKTTITKTVETAPIKADPTPAINKPSVPRVSQQTVLNTPSKPKPTVKTRRAKSVFSLHNFHIIQEADLQLFRDEYDLEEREITVALFDVEGVEETNQSVQLRAFVNRAQTEAFILEQAFKVEQQKHKPYRLLGSRKHYTLDWATDHILQKEGSLKRYLNFGPDSELEDFGYQVRTLKKEERWTILQHAVPIIGLQKAVDTIASHIQQRKAEENGEQFYANAITKWKNDLIYLKKHYYNKEFTWPKF